MGEEEIRLGGEDLRVAGKPDRIGPVEADGGIGRGCRCRRRCARVGRAGHRRGPEHGVEHVADALGVTALAVPVEIDPHLQHFDGHDIVAGLAGGEQRVTRRVHVVDQ